MDAGGVLAAVMEGVFDGGADLLGNVGSAIGDKFIEGGVDIINLQNVVNGIGWIEEHLPSKTCIDLNIDRQPASTAAYIDRVCFRRAVFPSEPINALSFL